ncbi:unnamed protein product [Larinioides sclopetarius]|uniref:Uncharacterized protein n=1 Tax=Larinioides sclopetarius TaxID=280406 RepID=A0AAV2BNL1_9ARAC
MSDPSDLGDMYDTTSVGNNDDPITIENVYLLAVECIVYYLRWNNIIWIPPSNPEDLRLVVEYEYFTPDLGRALVHHCITNRILRLTVNAEFDVETWLQLTDVGGRRYVKRRFHRSLFMLPRHEDDNFRYLYPWAYACYLCFRAARCNRVTFIADIFDRLSKVMHARFGISRHYYFLGRVALVYNRYHESRHERSDDEGHITDEEDDDAN